MAQSMNTKVDYVCNATSFLGFNSYGKIMLGDKAFEYYNERNVNDYIQIPWGEITEIVADVQLGGKWIPRFEVHTKSNGIFRFSAGKDTKPLLRTCRKYVDPSHMRPATSFFKNVSYGVKNLTGKLKK